jgi:uncharacterized membrane protein YeaQ/YmgE (transglycosylase-associated protein family)
VKSDVEETIDSATNLQSSVPKSSENQVRRNTMDGLLLTLLLTGAISGAAVGFLAVTLLPGKQMISKWETMAIGVGAAWIGGLIASLFGLEEGRGIHWASLAIQVGLAMVGVWLWLDFRNRRMKKMLVPDVPAVGKGGDKDKKDKNDKDKKIKPDLPGPM